MTLVVNPYEWHLSPAGETGPCSICGSAVSGQRPHRRAHSDRMWMVRGVKAAAPQPLVEGARTGHKP